MHMSEWVQRLDAFLQFNERNILTHAGAVSHQLAEEHAHAQFEQYDAERRQLEAAQPSSDFDRAVEEVNRLKASAATTQVSDPKRAANEGCTDAEAEEAAMMTEVAITTGGQGDRQRRRVGRGDCSWLLAELQQCFGEEYGYPPDLAEGATQLVLRQAELSTENSEYASPARTLGS